MGPLDVGGAAMIARRFGLLTLLAAWVLLSGHIGSPNVFFDGEAGPYPVRVVVRPPVAIPGLADISVRIRGGGEVTAVSVQPVRWDLGTEGAPRPDPARQIPGEPDLWTAELWFMDFGSYSVHVLVEGPDGAGRVIVPVPARATEIAGMPASLAVVLVGLGLFLIVGLLTIVGAAAREGTLARDETPDTQRKRRARRAKLVTLPILAIALFGGSRWWTSEEEFYARNLWVPLEIGTEVEVLGADRVLNVQITDSRWSRARYTPLLPDHGKLMHLFLVREPALDVFAHIHPERVDSASFAVGLPPLPAGSYRVYADILHESGMSQTLTDIVQIPQGATAVEAGLAPTGSDEGWWTASTPPARPGGTASLQDGSVMIWETMDGLRAGAETTLTFRVLDPGGQPAVLEQYMGMDAHAVVTRDDGEVFIHLHPLGTVSMTAQTLFAARERGDTVRSPTGELLIHDPAHAHAPPGAASTISIPYEFPRPGSYHVWVQVKRDGRVLTGGYMADVKP
jgi:hypothetical protein